MHVIVWGINYAPERTGIGPCTQVLCEYLARQGHRVRAVTSFAYYPDWRKAPADRGRWFRTDSLNQVTVHRCWHYVPGQPRAWKRMVHEASFVCSAFLRLLLLPTPDVYVVVSPPLLLGAAAWLLTRFRRAPVVLHVQDLQPDGAVELGLVRSAWLQRGLYALERFAYRHARRVSAISPGMCATLARKGVSTDKRRLLPNSVALPDPLRCPLRGRFRARLGVPSDTFLVTYAGNLGLKQGLDILLDVAPRLQGTRIMILLCGDGAARASLERRIARMAPDCIRWVPLQSEAGYAELMVDTDLAVITQQAGAGTFCFPSKLLAALAWGRPVLAVADARSELAAEVAAGGCGRTTAPGDVDALEQAICQMRASPSDLEVWGSAGRRHVRRYEQRGVLHRFETELRALVGRPRGALQPHSPQTVGEACSSVTP